MGALATSNPLFWIKADAITGLSDGAAITSVTDFGSGANNATNTGTITYKTNISPTGLPIMRFPGSAYFTSAAAVGGSTLSAVLVIKQGAVASSSYGLTGAGATGNGCSFISTPDALDVVAVHNTVVANTSAGAVNTSNFSVVGFTFNSGAWAIFVNGTSVASGTSGFTSFVSDSLHIGYYGDGANLYVGDMAEVATWSRQLTPTEMANIATELTSKWISTAPTGTLAATNADDSVSITGSEAVNGTLAVTEAADIAVISANSTALHTFEPPSHEEPIRTTEKPLCYFRLTWASSIMRVNGVLVSVRSPSDDVLNASGVEGKDFFRGGRKYLVDDATKTELQSRGYTVGP